MARAPDDFPAPTSRIAMIRLWLARALPGIIFAVYLAVDVQWDDAAERVLYSALGGLLLQLAPLVLVAAAYFFVSWVAGVDAGELDSSPFHSRRLLAGMVAVACVWVWAGIQSQASMKELIDCVEYRVEYEPSESIRSVIESCRTSDDDSHQDDF